MLSGQSIPPKTGFSGVLQRYNQLPRIFHGAGILCFRIRIKRAFSKINNDNYSLIQQRYGETPPPLQKYELNCFQLDLPEALLFENDKRREERMAVEDCLTCRGTDPVRTFAVLGFTQSQRG